MTLSRTVRSTVKYLQDLSTTLEIDSLALLLAEPSIAAAVDEGDRKMLSRVFGVSTLSYEQILRDRGCTYRNTLTKFEVLVNRKVVLEVPDDIYGTVGCAVVSRFIARDGTNLPSSYLRGGRATSEMEELLGATDLAGVRLAADVLPASLPVLTKVCRRVQAAHDKMTVDGQDDRVAVGEYTSAVAAMYTQLRTNPNPTVVRDIRGCGSPLTVGAYIKATEKRPGQSFVPRSGESFPGPSKKCSTCWS